MPELFTFPTELFRSGELDQSVGARQLIDKDRPCVGGSGVAFMMAAVAGVVSPDHPLQVAGFGQIIWLGNDGIDNKAGDSVELTYGLRLLPPYPVAVRGEFPDEGGALLIGKLSSGSADPVDDISGNGCELCSDGGVLGEAHRVRTVCWITVEDIEYDIVHANVSIRKYELLLCFENISPIIP